RPDTGGYRRTRPFAFLASARSPPPQMPHIFAVLFTSMVSAVQASSQVKLEVQGLSLQDTYIHGFLCTIRHYAHSPCCWGSLTGYNTGENASACFDQLPDGVLPYLFFTNICEWDWQDSPPPEQLAIYRLRLTVRMVGNALVVKSAVKDDAGAGGWSDEKETVLPPDGCFTEPCSNKDCSKKASDNQVPWSICFRGPCNSASGPQGPPMGRPGAPSVPTTRAGDGFVHFGDMLILCSACTRGLLQVDPAAAVTVNAGSVEVQGCKLSTGSVISSCPRSNFTVGRVDDNDSHGTDTCVYYGQLIRLG
ncbi:KLC2, partial [Symbiodinium sp. CCMP2456]